MHLSQIQSLSVYVPPRMWLLGARVDILTGAIHHPSAPEREKRCRKCSFDRKAGGHCHPTIWEACWLLESVKMHCPVVGTVWEVQIIHVCAHTDGWTDRHTKEKGKPKSVPYRCPDASCFSPFLNLQIVKSLRNWVLVLL